MPDWYSVKVTIPRKEQYYIAFKATRGGGEKSDIAIDDIKLHSVSGGCEPQAAGIL